MSASLASKSLSHVTAAVFAIFITSSKKLWSDSRVSSWLSLKSPLISEHILHFHFTGFCFTALPCRTLGRSNVKITTNVPTHMWTLSPRDNIGVLCTMKEPTLHRQWMAICPVVIFFPLDAWITSNIWKKKEKKSMSSPALLLRHAETLLITAGVVTQAKFQLRFWQVQLTRFSRVLVN